MRSLRVNLFLPSVQLLLSRLVPACWRRRKMSSLCTVIASHARTSLSSSPSPDLTTPPAPNLYVTYKVLQLQRKLLDRFRKRVRTRRSDRVLKKETSTRVTRDFCQDLERQAFEEIDRYLGRKTTAHSRKRSYPVVKHKWTGENEQKPKCIVAASPRQDRDQSSSRSAQWYVWIQSRGGEQC